MKQIVLHKKAQNLLNNVISEYNNKNRFIFICNDYTKINESIQSNCIIIKFHKISTEKIYDKLEIICKKENITYDEEGLNHSFMFLIIILDIVLITLNVYLKVIMTSIKKMFIN